MVKYESGCHKCHRILYILENLNLIRKTTIQNSLGRDHTTVFIKKIRKKTFLKSK